MPRNVFFLLILLCPISVLRASESDALATQACAQWLICLKSLSIHARKAYPTHEEKIRRSVVNGSIMRVEYCMKNGEALRASFLREEYDLLHGLLLDQNKLYAVLKQYPALLQNIGIAVVDNITIGGPVLQKTYASFEAEGINGLVYVSDMSSQ